MRLEEAVKLRLSCLFFFFCFFFLPSPFRLTKRRISGADTIGADFDMFMYLWTFPDPKLLLSRIKFGLAHHIGPSFSCGPLGKSFANLCYKYDAYKPSLSFDRINGYISRSVFGERTKNTYCWLALIFRFSNENGPLWLNLDMRLNTLYSEA